MASKKPAKVSSHEKKINTAIGSAFYYFGNTNKPFTCSACGRVFVKGIAYEKDGKSACTRGCLTQLLQV
jgi:hypothetical protein